jgi:hypothetical protein
MASMEILFLIGWTGSGLFAAGTHSIRKFRLLRGNHMEFQTIVVWALLGYAMVGVGAQSAGNATTASSASLAAVNALAVLFGGGGSTLASNTSSGSPAPSPGAINTRSTGQRGSRQASAFQSNTQGKSQGSQESYKGH